MPEDDWEDRVRAEGRIHAEEQSRHQVKMQALGCGGLIYFFACLLFPPLLLAIPVAFAIYAIRTFTRGAGNGR